MFSDVEMEVRLALAGAGDILGRGVPPVPEPAPVGPTRPDLYDEDDACLLGQAGEGFLPAAA